MRLNEKEVIAKITFTILLILLVILAMMLVNIRTTLYMVVKGQVSMSNDTYFEHIIRCKDGQNPIITANNANGMVTLVCN